jgi:glycolate oxidase iron-sulfur subunit
MAECVLCGCCLEGCPLLAATGREELSPRAKALLAGPSKWSAGGAELPEADVAALTGLCLACGRCEKLCPQGVKVPELMAAMRAGHPQFRQWLWGQWVTRLRPAWPLAARAANLAPEALIPANFGLALKGLRGLAAGSSMARWLEIVDFPARAFAETWGGHKVAVFDGCVGGGPRRDWGGTARRLLAGLQAETLSEAAAPKFSCCGSTLGVAGLPEEQAQVRRVNVAAWREAGRPLLVTYCATCRKGLAQYAQTPELFADEVEAAAWRAAVTPLAALLKGARAKAKKGAPPAVGYHQPCHAALPKELGGALAGQGDADQALLSDLLGSRLRVPAKSACCGFGGIMQLGAPDLCESVAGRCWSNLEAKLGFSAAPDVAPGHVLTGCSGCVMQLSATAPAGVRVGHWLDVIA